VTEIRIKRDLFENVEIRSLLIESQNFMGCFLCFELLLIQLVTYLKYHRSTVKNLFSYGFKGNLGKGKLFFSNPHSSLF
jgi:hypothetical protein